jgi:hypothetical protein
MAGIVLELIDLEPDDGHDVVLAGAHRRWRPLLAAAVAVALVAAVAFVGRNGGGTSAPPTIAPPPTTTTSPPPTDRPGRGHAPPPFVDSNAFMNFVGGRSATVLYGVTATGALTRIDLDAGDVTERQLLPGEQSDPPVAVFTAGGGAVVAGMNHAVLVGDGPDGSVTPIPSDGGVLFRSAVAGETWSVRSSGPGSQLAQRQHVDGTPIGAPLAISHGTALGDDGTGGLLVQTTNGVYRFDPAGGGAQRVSMAPLIAWSASTLVEEVCDDQFQCQWTVVDRATGDARSVGMPPAGAVVRVGQLSSDLARLAYLVVGPGSAGPSLEVLDLMTGQRTELDAAAMLPSYRNATGLVWSLDGQWLFWLSATGTLRGWSVGAAQPLTVDGSGHIASLQIIGLAT